MYKQFNLVPIYIYNIRPDNIIFYVCCSWGCVERGRPVARELFFNRVVKTNLFQLGVWGRCKAPAGSGAEPRRQADFDNNLLKIN